MDQSRTYGTEAATVVLSDEQLMEAVQHEAPHAFEMLMRRYERPLFNFIRRMIGSAADAEDLFQEVFLRVYHHRDRYRADRPFRPWLYGIATNRCKDYLRYQSHRRHASLQAPVSNNPDAPILADALADDAPGPDAHAEAAETRARLEAALQALPLKHRTVFLMARYNGLPYEEIARALRIPVGTVKSRMNKAVNILLAAIEEAAP